MDWCCVCGENDDWSGKHTCGVCGGHFGGEERVAKLSKWKNVANFLKCFFLPKKPHLVSNQQRPLFFSRLLLDLGAMRVDLSY